MTHIACPRLEGMALKTGRGVGMSVNQAVALAPSPGVEKSLGTVLTSSLGWLHDFQALMARCKRRLRLPERPLHVSVQERGRSFRRREPSRHCASPWDEIGTCCPFFYV